MKQLALYLAILITPLLLVACTNTEKSSVDSVKSNYTELPKEQVKEMQKVLKARNIETLGDDNLHKMKDYLTSKLLENPTPWGIDIRSNYFWNIYNALPSFVSAKERHTGYNQGARHYTNEEQLMAYSIWRIDRSSDNVKRLFRLAKPLLKSVVPDHAYTSWGIEMYVNEAIQSHNEIVNIPNYSVLLQNAFAQADTTTGRFVWEGNNRYFRSFENSVYGFTVDDLNQIIASHLRIDKHNNLTSSPWLSFWMRRNHEGNMETVYQILNEINELYNAHAEIHEEPNTQKSKKTDLYHKGKIVYLKEWSDKNGDNVLILSEERVEDLFDEGPSSLSVYLYAYHYANAGEGFNLINEVTDYQKDCDFENRARFMEESVIITDVNNNGYSEITFTYRLGCTSELSPDKLVLIAMEKGAIYTINGTTKVELHESMPAMGGETIVGHEFEKASKKLLANALKAWENQQNDHNGFEKPRAYILSNLENFRNLLLFGVEPFWSIKLNDGKLLFSQLSQEPKWFKYTKVIEIDQGFEISSECEETGEHLSLLFQKCICNDGMSDYTYPYTANLTINNITYQGCGRWDK
jgi:uncharacterized membrane protein